MTGTTYRLVRNSSVLSGAQIASRAITIVYGIVLSRYLGAAGFGSIGAALGVTALAYVFVDFGLAPLMVRDVARDHEAAGRYASNILAIKAGLVILVNAGLAVFLASAEYPSEVRAIIWIYSLNSALTAFVGVGTAGLQGLEEMHWPAVLQVGRDGLNVGLSLVAIALHAGIFTIVWVSVVATVLQTALMIGLASRQGVKGSLRLLSARLSRRLLRESVPFAGFVIIATLYGQVAVVMVSLLMPLRDTGLYAAAVSISAVVGMLSSVFAQAVFPVFSRYHADRPDMLRVAYEKMFRYLVVLGLGLSAIAALACQDAIRLVLGREYVPATTACVILIINQAFAANYINGTFLNSTGRQKLFTVSYALAVVLQVGASWWLIPRYGAAGAALGFLIPGLIGYVYYTVLCHHFLRLPQPVLLHLKCLVAASLLVGCVLLLSRTGISLLLSAVTLGPLVYGGAVVALRVLSRSDWDLLKVALSPIGLRLHALREGGHRG